MKLIEDLIVLALIASLAIPFAMLTFMIVGSYVAGSAF